MPNGPQGDGDILVCRQADDLALPEARPVIARLLREFLEAATALPGELLLVPARQARLEKAGGPLRAALDRAAKEQAAASGEGEAKRRKALDAVVAEWRRELPSRLGGKEPKPVTPESFPKQVAPATRNAAARLGLEASVATHLAEAADWEDKIARLLALPGARPDPQAVELLDPLLADVVLLPAATRALSGHPVGLEVLLNDLADLFFDDAQVREDAPDTLRRFKTLAEEADLPRFKGAVIQAVQRELRGRERLVPGMTAGPTDAETVLATLEGKPTAEVRCEECGNEHRPEEWDGSYL